MSIALYEHNQSAYTVASAMLAKNGKAVVIHPTGTGKSFIGFKFAEENPQKRILWLTPSGYIAKTQVENLRKESGIELDNIKFVTYSRLIKLSKSEMAELRPDMIIADEHHRMGAEQWQTGAERLFAMYPDTPRLGLSATNIRYLDNRRNMAEEMFDGNVASEMTLGEAVARNILMPPTYIISIYAYQKELKKYEERVERIANDGVREKNKRELDKLRRALESADGLDKVFYKHMKNRHGKYIVFCANRESMDELIGRTDEWFGAIDGDMHIYKVYCEDPNASRDFADFKADKAERLRLLFCIDMLNEGVHVDDIDGVILFRPTVSPIIYKQQIGRALSAGKSKHPIIFDVVNNFENLYSISTVQDEINLAVSYYRDLGESDKIINDSFTIIDETKDSGKLFRQLERTLAATWDIFFNAAREYYEKNGNLLVPKKYVTEDGLTLGLWIMTQKRVYKGYVSGNLSQGQIERLNSIGMVWDNINDLRWETGFKHAEEYYRKYGTLDVRKDYASPDGYKLGEWIVTSRNSRINGSGGHVLNEERIKRLDAIGMIWSKNNMLWERNYLAAAKYYEEHGNLDVPNDYVSDNGVRLGAWINTQKQKRKGGAKNRSSLTDEQIERLDSIGMNWTRKFDKHWEERYRDACEYYEKHGSLDVPAKYKTSSGVNLGAWIYRQRSDKNLSTEKREKLDRIGMLWASSDPWEKRYKIAENYYKEHGDLNISQKYVADNVWIGKWLYEQRLKKMNGQLDDSKIRRLDSIGMIWKVNRHTMPKTAVAG